MKSLLTTLLFCFSILMFSSPPLEAQKGSEAIYKDIKKLGVLANVLYVAAHPDDENTRMISYMSNHLAANTTYLSLTRGDGGQNLIGPEMREMLGLIRTHELLGARAIDGGHQLFTRANDFGYSKTAAESFKIWNRDEVLSDVVWAIRKTKPDIIITRFNTDTLRPNHGHHTASAILAVEAFDLAAKPTSFPEQLSDVSLWQPERIFWNTSWWFYGSREAFDQADKSRMIGIDIGAFDPVTGESNSEIAGRSRSMHKSQGFGSAETRGESLDYIELLKDAHGKIPKELFEGIDITWNRVKGGAPIGVKVDQLQTNFDFRNPSNSIPLLIDIRKLILNLPESNWKQIKLSECEKLITHCSGLFIEVHTDLSKVSPGTVLPVTLEAINRSNTNVRLISMTTSDQDTTFVFSSGLSYNQIYMKELKIVTPQKLSLPYWLVNHSSEGMYDVPDQSMRGIPADPPPIVAKIMIEVNGTALTLFSPVIFKTVDPAEGEISRPLSMVPPVAVETNADVLVFNKGVERSVQLTLTALQDHVEGELQIKIPQPGWKISPAKIAWSFLKSGESRTIDCSITPPDNTSQAELRPEIVIGNSIYHYKITTLHYPHLPYMSIVRDATVHLQSLDIKITPRPIAYIQGAGDDIASSMQQIGFQIDVLNPESISSATLSKYEVVLVGIRAFNTIESLAYKNKILFDWVKKGGTMIVQYNVSRGLVTEDIAPYPLTLSRDRITEENAPVSILQREHPAMNFPNKIDDSDFQGWAQERGLYFPNKWDEHFTPLLEMNDTGENPTRGALLVAPYGEGYYLYTGLSFFRHLPAGNPGPYRMLSNLIALGYKHNKS